MAKHYEYWNDADFIAEDACNYYADCEAIYLCCQCGHRQWDDAMTGEPKCCQDEMIETSATRKRSG